jgi:isopenicillin N synthase-like dioxygenase
VSSAGRIPVVSLRDKSAGPGARRSLGERLGGICHDLGFLIVVDHGVDPELVADVFASMERFFALDEDTKALIDKRRSPHFRGWEAVGTELTNGRPDQREQIDLWSEWPAEADGPVHRRLLGPNQWLPDDVLPGHRDLMTRWFAELGELADLLLDLLSLGLGLEEHHLRRAFGDRPMSLVKLIHYPPTPAGGAGVNAHHDTGFLTILAAGPTPGLQVEAHDGSWVDVPTVPDSFVVNLGEMLQLLTGNYFVATPHRVITDRERLSAGYFHGPSLDTPLDPLPLAPRFAAAVAASARHREAGVMARRDETLAGVGDMRGTHRPATYGEQLWNYFVRSYPDNVARHHPDAAS